MKRFLAVFLLLATLPAAAVSFPPSVKKALANAGVPEGAVAVQVYSLEQKELLLSHNASMPMNPASVMKLLTTFAALELLGTETTWETQIFVDAEPDSLGYLRGNLYFKGGGDPKLTLDQFSGLLRQLRVRGIQHIVGDVVLDRSIFNLPPHDPGIFDKRPMRAYNVGPNGFLVDFQALRFTLIPEVGKLRLYPETPSYGLQVNAKISVTKGVCEAWRDGLQIQYRRDQAGGGFLDISGFYPEACGEKTLYLAPMTPDEQVAGLFRSLWQELGGTFPGDVREGVVPPTTRLFLSHQSPPLAEVVRDINKFSNNVMARQIFLSLAAGMENSEQVATKRIKGWLLQNGLEFPELVLENGAGLSRKERISADSLRRLLVYAWQSPVMPEFVASLPVTGKDGTMKNFLKNTSASGRSHIKTGTLDGVKAAAGYALDTKGRWYVVVFMVNHHNAAAAQGAIDALLLSIVDRK